VILEDLQKEYLEKQRKLIDSKFNGPLEGLIDPPILEVVKELNRLGLDTIESCAGGHEVEGFSKEYCSHLEHPKIYQTRGYITFRNKLTKCKKENVRKIASSFGLRYIKFIGRQLQFQGLGGGQAVGWDEYLRDMDNLDEKYIDEYKKLERKR
jgi:hypothetical protein